MKLSATAAEKAAAIAAPLVFQQLKFASCIVDRSVSGRACGSLVKHRSDVLRQERFAFAGELKQPQVFCVCCRRTVCGISLTDHVVATVPSLIQAGV
jgi:hypothetical protein